MSACPASGARTPAIANDLSTMCSCIIPQVEVDLPIDTRAPTYDQVKAEELAQLVCVCSVLTAHTHGTLCMPVGLPWVTCSPRT